MHVCVRACACVCCKGVHMWLCGVFTVCVGDCRCVCSVCMVNVYSMVK